jgi:hypothetical protein
MIVDDKLTLEPTQIVLALEVAVMLEGTGFTVTTTVATFEQEVLASVAVTV